MYISNGSPQYIVGIESSMHLFYSFCINVVFSLFCSRHFFLVSELHGKVLDIEGGRRVPGADVIVWPRKINCRNQLWYIDAKHHILRSSLNDFVPESRGIYLARCSTYGHLLAVAYYL
jgi:hypothetical protein